MFLPLRRSCQRCRFLILAKGRFRRADYLDLFFFPVFAASFPAMVPACSTAASPLSLFMLEKCRFTMREKGG